MLLATQRSAGVMTRLHRRGTDGRYSLVRARFDPGQPPGEQGFRGARHRWVSAEEARAFFRDADERHVPFQQAFPEATD